MRTSDQVRDLIENPPDGLLDDWQKGYIPQYLLERKYFLSGQILSAIVESNGWESVKSRRIRLSAAKKTKVCRSRWAGTGCPPQEKQLGEFMIEVMLSSPRYWRDEIKCVRIITSEVEDVHLLMPEGEQLDE